MRFFNFRTFWQSEIQLVRKFRSFIGVSWEMSLTTPVAFIIFNRPDVTERVFQAIRQAQPQKLLVIADGPRADRPGEAEKCAAARAVIDRVDWDCEVLTNYSEVNLGCKLRVSSGIDWVFSEVEEAIILEDDCLPAPSFFSFCQVLLEKYRHDERVMMISGNNFQPPDKQIQESYYFSKYIHVWGWATWRRAWQHYDVEMSSWRALRDERFLDSMCNDPIEKEYWIKIFDDVANGDIDTWDYQWNYTCWQQSSMNIMPSINLISNIGFRSDATHTMGDSAWAHMPVGEIPNIRHPIAVFRSHDADTYTFDYVYDGKALRFNKTAMGKSIQVLRKIKGASTKWLVNN
jgi:hypothetical protein